MTDVVSPEVRSRMMAGIRGRDTRPELLLRRAMHARGFRFRLHRKDLPGSPDLVFPRYRVAVFVHGCFWHRHKGCRYTTSPKSHTAFWQSKFESNLARDQRVERALLDAGWRIVIAWECALRNDAGNVASGLAEWMMAGATTTRIELGSLTMDESIKRWTAKRKTALVVEIIQGKTTVAEASRAYDLSPSEIEGWVDNAKRGTDFEGTVAPDGAA